MKKISNKIFIGKPDRVFISIVLGSLLVKAIIIANVNLINVDAVRYFNSAYQLFNGNVSSAFAHEKMLFYTFTLGLFQLVFRDWALSGLLLSLVFLTLTLIPLYFFTKEIFGANAAIWTTIAFSLLPSINQLTADVAKDAPFLFFIMMALWLGRKALANRQPGCFPLTFSCALLATLFRFEGVVFLCVYFLWLLFNAVFRPSLRPLACRGLLLFAGIPVAALVLISGLFLFGILGSGHVESVWLRFQEHYFRFDLLGNYHAIYNQLKAVERNFAGGQWTNDFFEIARYNMPIIYLLGLVQILIGAIFPIYLVPLLFGLKSLKFSDDRVELLGWLVVAYLIMDYFFIVTRNFLAERYVLVVVVMLLPLVGQGFEQLRGWLPVMKFRVLINVVIVICFLCLPLYRIYSETREEKPEIRLAGEWLKVNAKPSWNKLITTDERIPFYAGLWREAYELFPDDAGQSFEAIASKDNFPVVILDVSSQHVEKIPEFQKYKLVKEFLGKKKTVLIYELNP